MVGLTHGNTGRVPGASDVTIAPLLHAANKIIIISTSVGIPIELDELKTNIYVIPLGE